eukprot:TRINITY_DN5302_c0_g1_i1.p1 TRINITY_DN5302_c0_g1~~TRINITY_DN5302_c0_g1_i1.p1  ORF type:complete len:258 (-),score=60.12 TRINITY_DN5302_c0_g1_i1:60-833(-)
MAGEDEIENVAKTLNGMGDESLALLVDLLEESTLRALRKCMQGLGDDRIPAAPPGNFTKGAPARIGGKAANGYGGKGGKGGERSKGHGKGKPSMEPILAAPPPPLDKPELLPATTEAGEKLAFQVNPGTPWRFFGPEGGYFRWEKLELETLSKEEKAAVREILTAFAEAHGLDIVSPSSGVKMALLRGDYWVSAAGGVSSRAGRTEAPQQQRPSRPAPKPAESSADAASVSAPAPPPPSREAIAGLSGAESLRALYK